MRILLDLTPLVTGSTLRGIGRYVRGLVQGLVELGRENWGGIELLGLAADPQLTGLFVVEDLAEYCKRPVCTPLRDGTKRRARLITFRSRTFARDGFHLSEPRGLPLAGSHHSGTAFDLIPLLLPESYLPRFPGSRRLYAQIERFRYQSMKRILAISHATKRDLTDHLGVGEDRIDVAWLGVDHTRFSSEPLPLEREKVTALVGSERPYVLYIGGGDPRKDLNTLIKGFAQSKAQQEAELVIAGELGRKRTPELSALVDSLGLSKRVKLLGYVDEELVPALYRNSRVHAFVSRYEGFGLPVLEALACGAVTITSPGSSLDEVAGNAAAIVPFGDDQAMTDVLDHLFFDEAERARLRSNGFARARTFTWTNCARATIDFWRHTFLEPTLGRGGVALRSGLHQ